MELIPGVNYVKILYFLTGCPRKQGGCTPSMSKQELKHLLSLAQSESAYVMLCTRHQEKTQHKLGRGLVLKIFLSQLAYLTSLISHLSGGTHNTPNDSTDLQLEVEHTSTEQVMATYSHSNI